MEFLTEIIGLMTTFAKVGGGGIAVWGLIGLGTGLSDQNGQAIQQGVWKIVGGGVILAAALLFPRIVGL